MEVKLLVVVCIFCIKSSIYSQNFCKETLEFLENNDLRNAENLAKNHPNLECSILYLGDIASHHKNWDKAIEYYSYLVKDFPKSAKYQFKLGGAMGMKAMEINKFQAAFLIPDIKEHLKEAVKLNPDHIESRRALSELYLQLPSMLGGGTDKAFAHIQVLEKLNVLDYKLALASYYSYKDERKLSAEIIKSGIKQLKQSPSLVLRNYIYFEFAEAAVRYETELQEVDFLMQKYIAGFNYLDLKTPAEAYLKLAQLSEKRGDKQSASKYISKSLEYDAEAEIALELQEDIRDM